jgi:hypothetical protein
MDKQHNGPEDGQPPHELIIMGKNGQAPERLDAEVVAAERKTLSTAITSLNTMVQRLETWIGRLKAEDEINDVVDFEEDAQELAESLSIGIRQISTLLGNFEEGAEGVEDLVEKIVQYETIFERLHAALTAEGNNRMVVLTELENALTDFNALGN